MSDEEESITKKSIEDKLVIHMNITAHQHMSLLLRPHSPGSDWKTLADNMGFTYEEILNFECDTDPVECIVRRWERQSDATVDKLLSFLEEMKRKDVIEDLQPFIDNTPLPSERRKKVSEKRQLRAQKSISTLSLELENLTLSDEIYDGFICYAKEDRSVANEILQKLEAAPYFRKICIDYRDYVPGNCGLDQTARIIEDRCKRIVVVMSPNFTSSPQATYQVQIALSLSPDARQRRVLPIMYKRPCEIPMLKHITHVDYNNEYFWFLLAKSLGYSPPPRATKTSSSPLVNKKKATKKKS